MKDLFDIVGTLLVCIVAALLVAINVLFTVAWIATPFVVLWASLKFLGVL